ncbi:hypothetical protein L210DRAFT_3572568 [Boletus edulis BED1]|uniref:Uncharacterized protein n=1 Tax=Boletus edulis BED1 TaxID=1328754 RepID=A0AAD4BE44_BOLED|nr:hypothetical protein L210DRAFT_3572568 [Boletus edulis BED1]
MMNLIQLVTTCQSLRRRKGGVLSLAKIHRHELQCMPDGPCLSTFMEWHAMGSKFAALAGGGSAYILILIAGLGLRVSIGSLPGDTPWALANILRAPTEARHRDLIEEFIAPTIARMKAALLITVDSHHLRQMYPCQSLSDSDNFYDSFDFNSFKLSARDTSVWCPVMTHSPPSAVPLHQPTREEIANSIAPPDADHLLPDSPHPFYDPPASQREEHENVSWAVSQRGIVPTGMQAVVAQLSEPLI